MFGAGGDDGRGVGVVWTRAALDREERPALLVPLVVGDAGWPTLTATVTLTLHVADVNDNPMAPAAKTVTVHTMQVCLSNPSIWEILGFSVLFYHYFAYNKSQCQRNP